MTDAERKLWRAVRLALPDHHWRKQVPFGPYIADFCSHGAKLIVELDGGQHAGATDYDEASTRYLQGQGYRITRFWNNDVLGNASGVLEQISLSLGRGKEQRQLREGEAEQALTSLTPSPNPLPMGEGVLES